MEQGTAATAAPNLPAEVWSIIDSLVTVEIEAFQATGSDFVDRVRERERIRTELAVAVDTHAKRQVRLTCGLLGEYADEIADNVSEANDMHPGLPVAVRLARILCNVGNIRGHLRALEGGAL
jgi:hypothetical protein